MASKAPQVCVRDFIRVRVRIVWIGLGLGLGLWLGLGLGLVYVDFVRVSGRGKQTKENKVVQTKGNSSISSLLWDWSLL